MCDKDEVNKKLSSVYIHPDVIILPKDELGDYLFREWIMNKGY